MRLCCFQIGLIVKLPLEPIELLSFGDDSEVVKSGCGDKDELGYEGYAVNESFVNSSEDCNSGKAVSIGRSSTRLERADLLGFNNLTGV